MKHIDIYVHYLYNGSIELSTIECDRRIHRTYMGYSLESAKRLFRQFVAEEIKEYEAEFSR